MSPRIESAIPDEVLVRTFARLDSIALGLAVGLVAGASLFTATAILILKGGKDVGQNLSLLNQYLPGFAPTWSGGVIGGIDAFFFGFVVGWGIAFLRNSLLAAYVYMNAFWARLDRFLDDM